MIGVCLEILVGIGIMNRCCFSQRCQPGLRSVIDSITKNQLSSIFYPIDFKIDSGGCNIGFKRLFLISNI
jgi:hypothetical protein